MATRKARMTMGMGTRSEDKRLRARTGDPRLNACNRDFSPVDMLNFLEIQRSGLPFYDDD